LEPWEAVFCARRTYMKWYIMKDVVFECLWLENQTSMLRNVIKPSNYLWCSVADSFYDLFFLLTVILSKEIIIMLHFQLIVMKIFISKLLFSFNLWKYRKNSWVLVIFAHLSSAFVLRYKYLDTWTNYSPWNVESCEYALLIDLNYF
jgi:hypothetical protein